MQLIFARKREIAGKLGASQALRKAGKSAAHSILPSRRLTTSQPPLAERSARQLIDFAAWPATSQLGQRRVSRPLNALTSLCRKQIVAIAAKVPQQSTLQSLSDGRMSDSHNGSNNNAQCSMNL